MDGTGRDPTRVGRLLVSLARNVATEVCHTVLASDTAAAGEAPVSGARSPITWPRWPGCPLGS